MSERLERIVGILEETYKELELSRYVEYLEDVQEEVDRWLRYYKSKLDEKKKKEEEESLKEYKYICGQCGQTLITGYPNTPKILCPTCRRNKRDVWEWKRIEEVEGKNEPM